MLLFFRPHGAGGATPPAAERLSFFATIRRRFAFTATFRRRLSFPLER
jgi:hypothetical protein